MPLTSCVDSYKICAFGPNIPRDRDDRDPATYVVSAHVHRCADPMEWRQRAFRRAFPMRGGVKVLAAECSTGVQYWQQLRSFSDLKGFSAIW